MHKSHNASLCMGFGPERTLCVMTISTVHQLVKAFFSNDPFYPRPRSADP